MLAQEELIMIKGKRSKRPRLPSPSPHASTIATTSSDISSGDVGDGVASDLSPSNSAGELTHIAADDEEEDMANCLILLAKGQGQRAPPQAAAEEFQCKTCSKSFPSFQALGGHRASHRKPNKPTNFEERRAVMREKQEGFIPDQRDDRTNLSLQISNCRSAASSSNLNNKTRVHECSICGAEFGSGQALGGHMRRHRPIPAAASGGHGEEQGVKRERNLLSLDLNLPAPEDDHQESKFAYAPIEQVTVTMLEIRIYFQCWIKPKLNEEV